MNLRDYQLQGINDIRAQFAQGIRRVCYVGPCGMGKTILVVYMASEAARKKNRTIFLVHRQELIRQTAKTFQDIGVTFGVISPGKQQTNDLIQIASVQTLARRLERIPKPDLIIADEFHHSVARTWLNIFNHWPEAYVVGLTATPARLGGQGLKEVSDVLILGPTAKELIQQGHLAPYIYYAPPQVADLSGIKIKMGDYDIGETVQRVNKPAVIGDALDHYRRLANGKRAIAYCASREHSRNTAAAFTAAGIPAKHVDGETRQAEREQAIEDFRTGRLQVLTNVDLFGEGLDVPGMEAVILLRPTQSLTLFIQQAMRPMRPDKKNPFKCAIILDHVGNAFRHGLPDDDREWKLEGIKKHRRSEPSTVSIKVCPNCYSVSKPADRCEYCGFEYPIETRELEEKPGELKELTAVERKAKRQEVGRARTLDELKQIAAERGYKPQWVRIQAKLKNIRE
ncbi:MAG: type restriction enzyme, res subunit [Firmicutes bacterium]|nr:type restriction enzyme, res subunit [Bacillota bacterium]